MQVVSLVQVARTGPLSEWESVLRSTGLLSHPDCTQAYWTHARISVIEIKEKKISIF